MIEDWEKAVEFVLRYEGSIYENDPRDPGGETKYGISHKAYPNIDIRNLTLEQAKAIYKKDYWEACSCDQLPFGFALATFDTAVNQGTGIAKRLLQVALEVEVDGVIGPKTIAAAHKAPARVRKYLGERLAEYARLMARKQDLLVYALNWSYRVLSLHELILGVR